MTPEEIMHICDDIYKTFLTPKYIIRQLFSIKSWEDVKYTVRGLNAVLGHIKDFAGIRTSGYSDPLKSL